MTSLTRWVLAHRRLVVAFWVVVTLVGIATSGAASKAMDQKFSVPGREGWETDQQIARLYGGTGGNSAPLVPVVTLPSGMGPNEIQVAGRTGSRRAYSLRTTS